MTHIRHLASAAAIIAGLHFAPAAAQPASPDVVYSAPAPWITAVVQGNHATVLTGNADLDRRFNVWLVGFGYGLGERCNLPESRTLQAALSQHLAPNSPMQRPAERGTKDGRRFAEINGCSSADTVAARRTVASVGVTLVADAEERRQPNRREFDRRDERRDTVREDRPNVERFQDRETAMTAREAIVINRSGLRIDVINMSETADNDWGSDRLGREVLNSGEGVRVPLANSRACRYDLRVVYADRRFEERMNVDLCTEPRVVFDGRGAQTPRQPAGTEARYNGSITR